MQIADGTTQLIVALEKILKVADVSEFPAIISNLRAAQKYLLPPTGVHLVLDAASAKFAKLPYPAMVFEFDDRAKNLKFEARHLYLVTEHVRNGIAEPDKIDLIVFTTSDDSGFWAVLPYVAVYDMNNTWNFDNSTMVVEPLSGYEKLLTELRIEYGQYSETALEIKEQMDGIQNALGTVLRTLMLLNASNVGVITAHADAEENKKLAVHGITHFSYNILDIFLGAKFIKLNAIDRMKKARKHISTTILTSTPGRFTVKGEKLIWHKAANFQFKK